MVSNVIVNHPTGRLEAPQERRETPQTESLTPRRIFDTLNAYQSTAALRTAIELDVFTAIARGQATAGAIAGACSAAERGMRALCDHLVTQGFLTKADGEYGLPPDAAMFLVKDSPAYMGSAAEFLDSSLLLGGWAHLTESVRRGTSANPDHPLEPDHPIWVRFARMMAPLLQPTAQAVADVVRELTGGRARKVLDIAAGHGLYGVLSARENPQAQIVAVDWSNVLEVARENAERMGVADRHRLMPGNALTMDLGSGYDVALVTNFLHHFDTQTCETFLRKVHGALDPGGHVLILEFVPNEDRVSPPVPAQFALNMLAMTPAGDVYTFGELAGMLERAGFVDAQARPMPGLPQTVVLGRKE